MCCQVFTSYELIRIKSHSHGKVAKSIKIMILYDQEVQMNDSVRNYMERMHLLNIFTQLNPTQLTQGSNMLPLTTILFLLSLYAVSHSLIVHLIIITFQRYSSPFHLYVNRRKKVQLKPT